MPKINGNPHNPLKLLRSVNVHSLSKFYLIFNLCFIARIYNLWDFIAAIADYIFLLFHQSCLIGVGCGLLVRMLDCQSASNPHQGRNLVRDFGFTCTC